MMLRGRMGSVVEEEGSTTCWPKGIPGDDKGAESPYHPLYLLRRPEHAPLTHCCRRGPMLDLSFQRKFQQNMKLGCWGFHKMHK